MPPSLVDGPPCFGRRASASPGCGKNPAGAPRLRRSRFGTPRPMRNEIGPGIFTIDAVLTPAECHACIEWSEGLGYEAAPVSLAGGAEYRPEIRNNARVMVESWDRAQDLWRRVVARDPCDPRGPRRGRPERTPAVLSLWAGPTLCLAHRWVCSALERRAEPADVHGVSQSTAPREEARFEHATVRPRSGLALVFNHYLPHEGAPVIAGQKYVLRSDVMYSAPRIRGG